VTDQPTTPDNSATSQINAPWTADQVAALERFQTEGHMHPFTCGGDQHSMAPRMIPSRSGWHCPDPDCSYTQDWAHAFMAQPAAWPKPWPGQRYRLTAAPRDPEAERAAEERAAQAAVDSERSAAWLAAQRADTGLRDQYAAAINAKIDGTAGCANGHRLADAVLAVRDREMEQMRLLVAASSEPGQAVRMAAQYADRAIENGERAEQAKVERDRVQEQACRTAESLRHAEERIESQRRHITELKRAYTTLSEQAAEDRAAIERVQGIRTIAPADAEGPTWAALDLAIRDALDELQQPTA
jgi:hypothetical protein